MKKCPGSISFTQPKPDIVKCSDCGTDVEIWSDEATGTCPACSKTMIRTETQSCVDWCKYAKECLGEEKYKKYGQMKAMMRKPALLAAMQNYFGADKKRIEHAGKVVAYAERILAQAPEADPNIVIAAAVLHDIGIKNAEQKHGSSDAKYQEEEGPPVARAILTELGYPEEFIREVCDIVGHHHHPRDKETVNFLVLYDADLLVNSEKQLFKSKGRELPAELLNAFLTTAGRQTALELSGGKSASTQTSKEPK